MTESQRIRGIRTADRRIREKEARRRSILDAAAAVFLERGISATTMDEIAHRAELSKGAVYLYFKSKEELYLALLVEASRVLVDGVRKTRDLGGNPYEQIVRLIRAYYSFYQASPDYFRLLFVLEHQPSRGPVADELRDEWTALGKESMGILASLIRAGIEQGLIRPCDPWRTAVALWAAVTGVIVLPAQEIRWAFLGHLDQEELVFTTVRNFWSGIQAAPSEAGTLPPASTAAPPRRTRRMSKPRVTRTGARMARSQER